MVIVSNPPLIHWNYFLALERELDVLSRYVEFDRANFDCFSIEIARILIGAAAETDVVCKQLCQKIDAASSADNILAYRREIVSAFADIPRFEVTIRHFGFTLHPWTNWADVDGVPEWWTAYNKIKHQRAAHYQQANLKNVLNAVAGLFVVTLYLYKEDAAEGKLSPTQLLQVGTMHMGGQRMLSSPLYKL